MDLTLGYSMEYAMHFLLNGPSLLDSLMEGNVSSIGLWK